MRSVDDQRRVSAYPGDRSRVLTSLDIVASKMHCPQVMTKTIPNGSYTGQQLLEAARRLGVSGVLVTHGRKTQTRAYPVRLESGALLMWRVNAPASEHAV